MVVDIKKRLLTMLEDTILTDVLFVVQGTEIKCHKLILSSCENRLKQLVANNPDKVDIDDVAPHTFQAILKYLYADDCIVTDANVFELMHAAKKFALDDLEHSCSEFILKKLTQVNVSFFTSQSLQFDAKDSLKVCLDYFRTNSLKVLSTSGFLQIPREVLITFCKNKGADCTESKFFFACFKWVKAECERQNLEQVHKNFRTVLGEDLLDLIEFQRMNLQEFLKIVVPTKVLTHEEIGRHVEEFQLHMIDQPIKVTITDHNGQQTTISRPPFTTIYSLKMEKIWNGGQQSFHADKFKLSHNGKTLQDDMTLFEIFSPVEDLCLEIATFEVTITDHNGQQTTISRPPLTTIYSLKTEKIWNGGQQSFPADKFTLSHKDKTLNNDMTLADIFSPLEDLCLEIETFDVILEVVCSSARSTCTLKVKELDNEENVILGFISTIGYGQSLYLYTDNIGRNVASLNRSALMPDTVIYYQAY